MKQKKTFQILYIVAGTLSVAGAIIQLLNIDYAPYVFSVGVALLIYLQFIHAWNLRKADLRKQRLARIGFISSLLLGLAAYFMFTDSNVWVVAVLIYSLSTLFLTFRGD